MPRIAAVAKALPPHRIVQSEARLFAANYFGPHVREIDRLLPVFDHAGIDQRYFCVPPEWFFEKHTFSEKNDLYIQWCTKLGSEVVRSCLERAGMPAESLDGIIFVSTTGLATPSIDSRLMTVLDLPGTIRRTPLWGLGCAGGASGLAHADQFARANPTARIMLVAVELCGLTFIGDDYSKSNLVATALFADGAAGVLVVGDEVNTTGPAIIASQSTTWPDSPEVMGWNFTDHGMQVVFSRAIPAIVRREIDANITQFLALHQLTPSDIAHWVVHPGGRKVIEAYEESLQLDSTALAGTRAILSEYGNMSSPTVLYVLEQCLRGGSTKAGDYALLTALGPGFSAETLLLQI